MKGDGTRKERPTTAVAASKNPIHCVPRAFLPGTVNRQPWLPSFFFGGDEGILDFISATLSYLVRHRLFHAREASYIRLGNPSHLKIRTKCKNLFHPKIVPYMLRKASDRCSDTSHHHAAEQEKRLRKYTSRQESQEATHQPKWTEWHNDEPCKLISRRSFKSSDTTSGLLRRGRRVQGPAPNMGRGKYRSTPEMCNARIDAYKFRTAPSYVTPSTGFVHTRAAHTR